MPPTYCTVDDVRQQLGLSVLPQDGPVTQENIEQWIMDLEDYVDRIAQDSWRTKISADELHDYDQGMFRRNVGVPIYLNNMNIFGLDSSEGDKLLVLEGNTWVDWLLDASRTEGRDKDYWVDKNKGIVYIRRAVWRSTGQSIDVTYRYGNKPVPGDIKEATRLLVAAKVLEVDDTIGNTITGSEGAITPKERVTQWREWATESIKGLARYRAMSVPTSY